MSERGLSTRFAHERALRGGAVEPRVLFASLALAGLLVVGCKPGPKAVAAPEKPAPAAEREAAGADEQHGGAPSGELTTAARAAEEVDALAAKACACSEAQCARGAWNELKGLMKKHRNPDGSDAEFERLQDAATRALECLTALGIERGEIMEFVETLGSDTEGANDSATP